MIPSPSTLEPTAGQEQLAEALAAALPQTQCTRCGYVDCSSYATAVATGSAAINQCPPGGEEGIQRLAALTGRDVLPLNPAHGSEGPRQLAVIDEAWCIGCTLCLQACPVDAILGGTKSMHTVIEALCTGCELCVPVCPVDCIALVAVTGTRTGWQAWSETQAARSRQRYAARKMRLEQPARNPDPDAPLPPQETPAVDQAAAPAAEAVAVANAAGRRQAVVAAALARARDARQRR